MNEKLNTADAYGFFGSPQGELIVKDLERLFGVHAPAFIQDKDGRFCPLKAAMRDGQRSVVLHLINAYKRTEKTETKAVEAVRGRD